MKFSLLVCVVLSAVLASLLVEVKTQSVSCEKVGTENVGRGSFKTCFMKETTAILSDDFVISPADTSVEAINSYNNKKIHFLPVRLGETSPNMVHIYASGCSIKSVSKKNLKNLQKLKFLLLGNNQIERINGPIMAMLLRIHRCWKLFI